MIRFANIEYLYALAVIPVMIVLYVLFLRLRAKAAARFGNPQLLERLAGDASRGKRHLKFVLLLVAVTFLLVALADPRIGTRLEDVKQEGVDIFIALDVSLSMKS